MIRFTDDRSRKIVGDIAHYLELLDLTELPVEIEVAPDEYASVKADLDNKPDGYGFGAYLWFKGRRTAAVSPKITVVSPAALAFISQDNGEPDPNASAYEWFVETVFHEYRHHLQWAAGYRKPSEIDAKAWAEGMCKAFALWQRQPIRDADDSGLKPPFGITINGIKRSFQQNRISYAEIVRLAMEQAERNYNPNTIHSVTFFRGHRSKPSGIVAPGDVVPVVNGMMFEAFHTGNA